MPYWTWQRFQETVNGQKVSRIKVTDGDEAYYLDNDFDIRRMILKMNKIQDNNDRFTNIVSILKEGLDEEARS